MVGVWFDPVAMVTGWSLYFRVSHFPVRLNSMPGDNLPYRAVVLTILLIVGSANAQLRVHYIYHPRTYGTDAQFGPASTMVNGTFDVLRNTFTTRKVQDIQYWNGVRNVTNNLVHADDVICQFNEWSNRNFWKYEVLPMDWDLTGGAWVPNYQTHIVGEGLVCRQLAEWYDAHDYRFPYLMGVMTTASFQFMNEVVENDGSKKYSVDPVADLLIFNPIGWALFYFDPVAGFFGEKLHFANWSGQPMLNPYNGIMTNAGEQFMVRTDLPWTDHYRFMYTWGSMGGWGLSLKGKSKRNYSATVGLEAEQLTENVNKRVRWVTAELEPHFSFFYDREGSLLFGISQTGYKNPNIIVNIYPGFIHSRVGVYAAVNRLHGIHVGISVLGSPLGLFAGA
jgi:hypothetical protein